jgi:hypothetical protein
MKVAVLGTGPAGMFAVHACVEKGVTPSVISNTDQRSELRGAQYLHREIPGVTDSLPSSDITYVKLGYPHYYSQRVYGTDAQPELSWNTTPNNTVSGWNLRRAYFHAFRKYRDMIDVVPGLNHTDVDWLSQRYDLVINSVPLAAFTEDKSDFEYQDVWVVSENLHYALDNRNIIVYNGNKAGVGVSKWYRYSQLFGWTAEEYGTREEAPHDAVRVRKPLRVRNSPVPDNWLCVGRYGAWRKRALTHDAFYDVTEHLEKML